MSIILTNRNVVSVSAADGSVASAGSSTAPDDGLTAILKLFPGDVAAAYTAAVAMAGAISQPGVQWAAPIALAGCIALVILRIQRDGRLHTPPVTPDVWQYVFELAAFVAWAFAIHNPFEHWFAVPTWIPALAVIFLPILGSMILRGGADTSLRRR